MSTYAAFEPGTERYLRGRADDTYTRSMFEVINDNEPVIDWELDGAARWRPEFGWTHPFEKRPHQFP